MELVDFSLDPEANAVQICRLSEKPGKVWVCRQQIHNELLQSLCIHRSTLSRLLDKADAIQREATFEEKMFLWQNGAVKGMTKCVILTELSSLCKAVKTITHNQSLVKAVSGIQNSAALTTESANQGSFLSIISQVFSFETSYQVLQSCIDSAFSIACTHCHGTIVN